jgi:glutathione S-transferase
MPGANKGLKLYYHPLSSFCWKALIALYENDTPFEAVLVNLQDEKERADFLALWPIGKFPVLVDDARGGWMVPESSIIIEYLAQHYPGKSDLVSKDADTARQIRMRDRFFDLYIQMQMQKIVNDHMRPADQKDAMGTEQAKTLIRTAYGMLDGEIKSQWSMGDSFTMADCAAVPALEYARRVVPFGEFKNIAAYLERLKARPSVARVLKEAEPYRHMFPIKE